MACFLLFVLKVTLYCRLDDVSRAHKILCASLGGISDLHEARKSSSSTSGNFKARNNNQLRTAAVQRLFVDENSSENAVSGFIVLLNRLK